jgi:hypothetical protein
VGGGYPTAARLDRPGEARQAWLTALPILDRLGDPRLANLLMQLGQPRVASA